MNYRFYLTQGLGGRIVLLPKPKRRLKNVSLQLYVHSCTYTIIPIAIYRNTYNRLTNFSKHDRTTLMRGSIVCAVGGGDQTVI